MLFLLPSIAQEKGDIGIIFSTSNSNSAKLAIEYRKPMSEKFNFKIAATYGDGANYFWSNNGRIVSVSDSAVTELNYYEYGSQVGLRFGAERQFGNSMFSIGADLNIDYRRTNSFYYNNTTYLQENGSWDITPIGGYSYFGDEPLNSNISRHYLVPGARLNFNMDIPMGKSFLLNLSAIGIFQLPIYMGESQKKDPNDYFIGIPATTFDLNTNLGIGLRYKIGSRNKKRG